MSVSCRLVLVAAAASAYVVPLRARASLRATLRRAVPIAATGAQNATESGAGTEFGAGLVSGGAAVAK